jgi:hypothetical protein
VTHVYVETAVSGDGFFGQSLLGPFLDALHDAGIAVFNWDAAALYHPAADARGGTAALRYRTALGSATDGLGADLENNLAPAAVAAYARRIHQAMGPGRLFVAVIYPVADGFPTPISVLARYVQVFGPMDYWWGTPGPYDESPPMTYAAVYADVVQSVQQIRETPGEDGRPVTILAQTQDVNDASGFGWYNPTPYQLEAAMAAAARVGAAGISFYDLRTQTPGQMAVLERLSYPLGP